jgi:benzoyl-CoA reductase/2-hydroxyglutaryl-CoA dehydratase subunit BcrC/BadD/HgdB
MVLERGRAAQLLEEVAAELEKAKGGGSAPGPAKKRILLSGGVCNHPDLYEVIEAAGGAVVGDDLCTGSRYFGGLIDETAEPVAAIAERYRERVVCPAKHKGLTDRADQLVGLVRQRRARGVIFFLLKFCDPHAFDYPCLREALEKQGIPSLLMEVEDRLPADGQLRTRFEAFIEMI